MVLEMEWNGNGNGMDLTINHVEFSKWKNSDNLVNSIQFHSTQFHSISWNSTFHLKMETSGGKVTFLFLVPNLSFFAKDFKKNFECQVGGEGQIFFIFWGGWGHKI